MAIRYPVRLSRLGRGRPRLMGRPFSSPNPVDWSSEQTIAGSLGYSQTMDQPPFLAQVLARPRWIMA
jgi:hypothetical protein